jgi:hypothetical protein
MENSSRGSLYSNQAAVEKLPAPKNFYRIDAGRTGVLPADGMSGAAQSSSGTFGIPRATQGKSGLTFLTMLWQCWGHVDW